MSKRVEVLLTQLPRPTA
uniref:Uncharacterized 1.9 kDa protein in aldolase locus n=1 Tax=Trypanosoma brucei brucei TaxID=5702 RepID=YALA_TRYBB|nr:RecName: Full=Uncharacterized 1.9 kDa protein in aldolase locus; AltName: Full=ORFA [Trypanosoma brucei brucei]CAA36821.1 unnamed protein product [Trypanosoma brucei]